MIKRFTIDVENMTCNKCFIHIQDALECVPGVLSIKSMSKGRVVISAVRDIDQNLFKEAIERESIYKVTNIS